jgi:hypothetical protein
MYWYRYTNCLKGGRLSRSRKSNILNLSVCARYVALDLPETRCPQRVMAVLADANRRLRELEQKPRYLC